MSLAHLLEPAQLVQAVALALSIFNLVAFLWLTLTVLLNGDREAGITRLGIVGLGLSAFFFFLHAMLISSPLPAFPTPPSATNTSGLTFLDILWHFLWLPGLGVPYIWFTIGLHYAALISPRWRQRRPMLLISSGILGFILLLLLIFNQSTATFVGTLRLLVYGDPLNTTHAGLLLSLVLLPVLFLVYVTFCAIGPWFTPSRVSRLLKVLWNACLGRLEFDDNQPLRAGSNQRDAPLISPTAAAGRDHQTKLSSLRFALEDAFWDDPADVELLEEPILSWHLARPGLLLAALLMAGLTTSLGVLGLRSLLDWLAIVQHHLHDKSGGYSLPAPPVLTTIPLNLLVLDLIASGAVALIILLLGYSVVRHGVLIERPLPRRGFLEQWRGIVIVATTIAIFIVLLVNLTHSSLAGLLLITSLATVVYAMFTWSSYTAHDRYIALLGPFLRSTGVRHWLNIDLQKTEQGLEDLFSHLCHDVLAVRFARLVVRAGPLRRSFNYCWPVGASAELAERVSIPRPSPQRSEAERVSILRPAGEVGAIDRSMASISGRESVSIQAHRLRMTVDGQMIICWVLPMYDERGLVATLYLGPRQDGGAFTDEDMDLAHACGQRILDTLGDHEAMQAVAGLLRHRIVDVKLLGAQQRRVLHDEILPQMHLALLRLEKLHSLTDALIRTSGMITDCVGSNARDEVGYHQSSTALDEAIGLISDAHRRLAAMMRATVPSAPHHLERDGMMYAIRTMLEQDFQNAFDEVEWRVSHETATCIDEITPPAIAELIFAAVQEALRNAARHARGPDVHRRLRLILKASCDPHLEVIVADDGVGLASANGSTTGTGGGLLTHSALLAIAGGSLTIKSAPGEGVTVRIFLPAEALR
jgi:signal transduction histidine kinase